MLPLNTNIRVAYANGKDDEQNFIQNLSLFLCTFLKEHGQLIEKRPNLRETLMEVGAQHRDTDTLIFGPLSVGGELCHIVCVGFPFVR